MPEPRTAAHILVVEDDRRSRMLLAEILRDSGYQIVEAGDGERALRELRGRSARFDLVVLDVQMPKMDGIAVAREIRRDERLRDLPILAVTALDRPQDVVRILEAGCDAYLSKPISIADVRELVNSLLADRHQQNGSPQAGSPTGMERVPEQYRPPQFVATLSREIRAPLTSILGFSELLEETADELTPQRRRYINEIRLASEHLLSLTNDVLDYSRIEAGAYLLRREPFAPAAVVAEVMRAFEPIAVRRRTQLRATLDGAPPLLYADQRAVRQVVTKLVSNAIMRTEGTVVEARVRQEGTHAVFEVSDTGSGIPAADLTRLFDPFQQMGLGGGTGLELTIVRELVRLHGGTVEARSEPQRGSLFTVRLPLS